MKKRQVAAEISDALKRCSDLSPSVFKHSDLTTPISLARALCLRFIGKYQRLHSFTYFCQKVVYINIALGRAM